MTFFSNNKETAQIVNFPNPSWKKHSFNHVKMSNVAEKARFYMERAVPQLREFEAKEIFSKVKTTQDHHLTRHHRKTNISLQDEIRTLVTKRSEFEHKVLGPGSLPQHFQAYIAWELSLEALRVKRCKRLGIKHSTSHAGQARVFNIYERSVFRHPGTVLLWRQYLDYAASVKATRRWRKIVTRALRLHPTNSGLWILAGRRAASNGDMENARSLFMRGCRFCNSSADLWVEYARVEMEWLGKMESKKGNKKALESARAAEAVDEGDMILLHNDDMGEDDEFGDGEEVLLPDPLASRRDKDAEEAKKVFNEEAVKKLESSPALEGAIPKAIFEVSRKQPFFGAQAGEAFFDMFAKFTSVSAQPQLVQHVLDCLVESYPRHSATCSCLVKQPLIGVDVGTAAFPKALRESLARMKTYMETTDSKPKLAEKTLAWIDPILAKEDVDTGIRTVLEYTKRKLESP